MRLTFIVGILLILLGMVISPPKALIENSPIGIIGIIFLFIRLLLLLRSLIKFQNENNQYRD